MTWLVGSHSLTSSLKDPRNIYKTQSYMVHPKFRNETTFDDYDMSIGTVNRKIIFSLKVKPICLPDPYNELLFENRRIIVAGKKYLENTSLLKLCVLLR